MKSTISIFACLALVAVPALAEDMGTGVEMSPLELDPIVVVASKRPRSLSDVAGQVSVIDAEFIQQHLVENMDNLLRYEPGINLESAGTRFGAGSINIRGIGGNRVAIEIDGVPVRDRFAVGSYADAGRILMETDRIKRLEVMYGPASTLYGSDALGGVVAISTWDPDDFVNADHGSSRYSLRTGYQGSNDSMVGSGVAAWADNQNGFMLAASWRKGHELENQAAAGAPRDEQDWSGRDYFARFTHDSRDGDRLRLTLNDLSRDVQSVIKSLPGYERFRNTTSLKGDDSDRTRRLVLDYQFSRSRLNGVLRVFDVSSSTQQATEEIRSRGRNPVFLERHFRYDQDFRGLELNLSRRVEMPGGDHQLSAGIEYQESRASELRDGYQQSLVDGSITSSVLGENFPVRDFPNSRIRELGIFVKDEIRLDGGRWEITPALRYDRYELDPRPDDIYRQDNPSTSVVSINEAHLNPRLGVLYHLSEPASVYVQYVNGFRAPPFEDANIGMDIPLFNVRAIPNPDLQPETSNGIEIGLRYRGSSGRLTLAYFSTYFDDFIESKALIGIDGETGTLLFQSRNIDEAHIYGLDLRLQQSLSAWSQLLENWTLDVAAFWSRGSNEENGQPLNSIFPPQVVLGLSWLSAEGQWTASVKSTFTAAKRRIDETDGERFLPPSWSTTDLTAAWHISDQLDLSAGVYNLFNETYWRWSDVMMFSPDNPMIELLSRPGRNYSVSATFRW